MFRNSIIGGTGNESTHCLMGGGIFYRFRRNDAMRMVHVVGSSKPNQAICRVINAGRNC